MSNTDEPNSMEEFMKLWQDQCNRYAKDPEAAKAMYEMFVDGQKLQQDYFNQFFQHLQNDSDDLPPTDTPTGNDDVSATSAHEFHRLWQRIAHLEERVANLEANKHHSDESDHS